MSDVSLAGLRAAIDRAGYYPELVAAAVDAAVAGDEIEAFVVHQETTFDAEEVRRHITVLVLTPGAGSGTIVTFNGLGQRVANSDGSAMLTQIGVTSSASSSAEIRSLNVVIGASGSIKMCDPDPVLVAHGDPRAC